jgi:hypothetical protein
LSIHLVGSLDPYLGVDDHGFLRETERICHIQRDGMDASHPLAPGGQVGPRIYGIKVPKWRLLFNH